MIFQEFHGESGPPSGRPLYPGGPDLYDHKREGEVGGCASGPADPLTPLPFPKLAFSGPLAPGNQHYDPENDEFSVERAVFSAPLRPESRRFSTHSHNVAVATGAEHVFENAGAASSAPQNRVFAARASYLSDSERTCGEDTLQPT